MKAWELISDPQRWTQGSFAKNKNGDSIFAIDPDACQWCAYGALRATYGFNDVIIHGVNSLYRLKHKNEITIDNDRKDMTAAVMSERLRVVEEEVLGMQS